MYKKLLFTASMLSILILAYSINHIMAQNATKNASNTAGNMTTSAAHAASKLGQNASSVMDRAADKLGFELGRLKQNMSTAGTELGQNMSTVGTDLLNKTEEAAKKVGNGAADILSNISGEIKEGINGK